MEDSLLNDESRPIKALPLDPRRSSGAKSKHLAERFLVSESAQFFGASLFQRLSRRKKAFPPRLFFESVHAI
jgi:hypothetical protein